MVGLDPPKADTLSAKDRLSKLQSLLRCVDTAPILADVDVYQELDGSVCLPGLLSDGVYVAQVIHTHGDLCPGRGECGHSADLWQADDFVAQEHVVYAALNHCLGLRQLLTAHPFCPKEFQLRMGNLGALVGLDMGPDRHRWVCLHPDLQRSAVCLKSIEVHHQRRGLDAADRVADLSRWAGGRDGGAANTFGNPGGGCEGSCRRLLCWRRELQRLHRSWTHFVRQPPHPAQLRSTTLQKVSHLIWRGAQGCWLGARQVKSRDGCQVC
mmetsp:Transcript_18458/g.51696  ORF Transcript_18458/g.51696 Transcript_18458/m.51696 type:complete len:268 (+) Transcript_18458:934-1737(+)